MDDKAAAMIDKLATVLQSSPTGVVDIYTQQQINTSIVWMVFGGVILALAFCSFYFCSKNKDDDAQVPLAVFGIVLTAFGCLIVFSNVADLVAPRAAAIHQLLRDIKS